MRIAVTSQNFRTITGHAGKTRRFLVLEVTEQRDPLEVARLDLPAQMALHDYHGEDHPLFTMNLDAVVTQSAGRGFVERLSRQGITVHVTSATDPASVARDLAAGRPLPVAAPHDHDHDHAHPKGRVQLTIERG